MIALSILLQEEFLFMINIRNSQNRPFWDYFVAKSLLISPFITFLVAAAIISEMSFPQIVEAEPILKKGPAYEVSKKVKMVVTAYSSTKEQTDNTPFITASGKEVAEGIVANNMLAFGTKIRIPKLYGNKVFVVEDRMNKKKGKYHTDIWFEDYHSAKSFGAIITEVEVLKVLEN